MAINVRMAEWKKAQAPDSLKTLGLGSCVAVVIYDEGVKKAAMAHVMLPSSKMDRSGSFNAGKYADTAIPEMIAALCKWGARRHHLKAKMAGGAQMFQFLSDGPALSVGKRNVTACMNALAENGIPLIMQDTGGTKGRSVEYFCADGTFAVRTVDEGAKVLT